MIPVARDGSDSGPTRKAIRHVQAGGVLGVFPEGALVRPRDQVRPFHPGVGFIIAKTRAPVLLVWISGTSEPTELGPALTSRSHARLDFIDRLEFPEEDDPATIAESLRHRVAEASGWPLYDEPLTPSSSNAIDPFAAN
jgi:1-acyl-sn-glycerol-3-phosphate acyltransferase